MRTEAEIREALQYLQHSIKGAPPNQSLEVFASYAASIDLLKWVLGKPANFDLFFVWCQSEIQKAKKN